jgi:hypothetical protein
MRHVVLLPERYRIGDVISFKIRRVPSIPCDRLTVCCAKNQRFLYPTANDFEDVSEDLDGWGERDVTLALKEKYPQADHVKISRAYEEQTDFTVMPPCVESCATDILICPRKKDNSSPHRNWNGWDRLYAHLVNAGHRVVAVGKKDQSGDCITAPWIHDLDHIASAMTKTKLVVATDAGLAHLAILLRVPLAVIWGTPVGVIPGQSYEKGCHKRMEHQKRSPVWHIEGGWEDVEKTQSEVKAILCHL